MTKQIHFQHNVCVARPANQVLEYLRDFDNASHWRVGLIQATATPTGPAKPGTLVHQVSRLLNRYVATDIIVDDVTTSTLTFSHVAGAVPMHGSFRCDEHPDGTNVTHTLTLQLRGSWMMFAAHLQQRGARAMSQSMAALKHRLESAPRADNPECDRLANLVGYSSRTVDGTPAK
jgi:hypothetical protein